MNMSCWCLLFFLLFLFQTGCFSSPSPFPQLCHPDEKSALLQLKQKHYHVSPLYYNDHVPLNSWNPNTDCCFWEEITCDGTSGHVVGLDLFDSSLFGSIDSNSTLFNLHHLQLLNLSYNYFVGPIPSQLTDLVSLDLFSNQFGGQMPSQISKLTKLVSLDLSSNYGDSQLEIPNLGALVQNLCNLRELHLDFVNLSAPKNRDWCRRLSSTLPNLQVLSMTECSLTGPLDASISSLRFLSELYLGKNFNLYSTVPTSLMNLTSLTALDLDHCGFHGDFPINVFLLPNLKFIRIRGNRLLSGYLPEFHQLNNTALQYLVVGFTKFQGKLPSSIGNLKFLKVLGVGGLNISGPIPPFLANLTHLILLGFSSNSFIGQIPSLSRGSFPHLETVVLSDNLLQGPIHSICNASNLDILDLSNNQLSGTIPTCLGSSNLGVLDLENNKLHGPIPPTFKNGCKLHTLKLNKNMLQGKVPRSLDNCKELKVLDVADNQLNDTFPHWLENLSELQVLVMRCNRFGGPIAQLPQGDSPFQSLHVIDISFNNFSGNLPSQYICQWKAMMFDEEYSTLLYYDNSSFYRDTLVVMEKGLKLNMERILTTFATVDLSNNNFEGKISNALGILKALKVLNLSGNSLTGQIPFSLENLIELESLDLSRNKLSGEIPSQLINMISLEVLNLSYNNFTGRIPLGNQFNTFSNLSYEGNARLCGFPLSRECGIVPDGALHPTSGFQKEEDDSTCLFDWKFALAGYCSGLIIGLVIGQQLFWRINRCSMFISRVTTSKPKKKIKKNQTSQ